MEPSRGPKRGNIVLSSQYCGREHVVGPRSIPYSKQLRMERDLIRKRKEWESIIYAQSVRALFALLISKLTTFNQLSDQKGSPLGIITSTNSSVMNPISRSFVWIVTRLKR